MSLSGHCHISHHPYCLLLWTNDPRIYCSARTRMRIGKDLVSPLPVQFLNQSPTCWHLPASSFHSSDSGSPQNHSSLWWQFLFYDLLFLMLIFLSWKGSPRYFAPDVTFWRQSFSVLFFSPCFLPSLFLLSFLSFLVI